MLDLNFGNTPEKLKGEYLDMYKGIQSKVIGNIRFDEISNLRRHYNYMRVMF